MSDKTCSADDCPRPSVCRKMCRYHYQQWRRTADRSEIGRWKDPEVRFEKSTRWGTPSDHRPDLGPCLLFTGADNGNGYGQFRHKDKNGYAHRYAWERVNGPIPDGLTVDHLCRVRRCVNVEHMELTDGVDNYLRGVATRTHCRNGHEYTPENTLSKPGRPESRYCKICREKAAWDFGVRRTNAARGIPDGRVKYDQKLRAQLVEQVLNRQLSVAQAAKQLGCSAKYMDGLTRRHRENGAWNEPKTRSAVRQRSDGWCEVCGLSVAQEMHHRKNRSQLGAWTPANILHLCSPCHLEITTHPQASCKLGHSVRSHELPEEVPTFYRGEWLRLDNLGNLTPMEGIAHG